jgi:epoxyqueuosine reductase
MHEAPTTLARKIRQEAHLLGFSAIGFAAPPPGFLAVERYDEMLRDGRHGEMTYLETGAPARRHPESLLPGLKTVISLAVSYLHNPPGGRAKLSRYAMVADYHTVMRKKAEALLDCIERLSGCKPNAFIAVDGAPVLEKEWAERSGMARTGKNTLAIVPSAGTFVFLGELLLDIEIREERPLLPNLCGSCTKCIDACPTGALQGPGKIDARRCISYLTIELKREFTAEESAMIGRNLFGCDTCQEHCPHNQRPAINPDPAFSPRKELTGLDPERILQLTRSGFNALFAGTPVWRIGLKRLKRNARAVLANEQQRS